MGRIGNRNGAPPAIAVVSYRLSGPPPLAANARATIKATMSDYMTYISTSTYEGQLDELRFETLISQLRTIIGQLPAGVQLSAFAAWFGGVRLYGWEE